MVVGGCGSNNSDDLVVVAMWEGGDGERET